MVQYKLYYFDVAARGEPIRMIFHYACQQFEDVRIKAEDWRANKPKFTFGQLPVLEVDGNVLAQRNAIVSYLGKKFGLAGKDDWEEAKAAEATAYFQEISQEILPYLHVKLGFRKKGDADQLRKELFLPAADTHFPILEKLVTQSESDFILPSGISFVDFFLASFLATMVKPFEAEYLAKYPKLMKYVDRVHGVPQLKEYMSKRQKEGKI